MKFRIIHMPFLPVSGMAIFPFVFLNIVFEREAYENDTDSTYLAKRKFASWRNYL